MKLIVTAIAIMLLSFNTQVDKTITLTFTVEEVQIIYDALGELPAKKVEGLRTRIALEANRQLADTTKKK